MKSMRVPGCRFSKENILLDQDEKCCALYLSVMVNVMVDRCMWVMGSGFLWTFVWVFFS